MMRVVWKCPNGNVLHENPKQDCKSFLILCRGRVYAEYEQQRPVPAEQQHAEHPLPSTVSGARRLARLAGSSSATRLGHVPAILKRSISINP
ncbi:hypothetical protein WA026_015052 [Henosepilachna vigintioctopunctata]|uniref:Uncharacterized protein n=1 Tax=Henosepilachna vigintioctopunctata TaxID=420089 RepID=A0AAW1U1S9_9CUCU